MACVDEERSVLTREREAFRELKEAIRSNRPVRSTPGDVSTMRTIVETRGSTATVARAYRKTVMATDHYESQYGESLEENVSMELGPAVASALQANAELNPLLHRNLLLAVDGCLEKRSNLLGTLETERESLRNAIDDCRDIDRRLDEIPECRIATLSFDELETHWQRLNVLEGRCERVVRSRQRFLTERRSARLTVDDASFNDYLYAALDSTFPVLETGLELRERIDWRR